MIFWIVALLIVALLFVNLPLPAFLALAVILFISTASVVVASNLVIGKASFANAFKANALSSLAFFLIFVFSTLGQELSPVMVVAILIVAFFAMIFVFSSYLETTIPSALLILILAGIVNAGGLWVLGTTAGLGLELTGNASAGFFKN